MVQKHGSPHNITTVNGLEQIQKAAARFVCSDYRNSTSSSSLVSSLKWDCLHTRRILTQCTLFYKIQNQLVATPFPPIVSPATYYGRYDHTLKYAVPAATIDVYKFSSSRESSGSGTTYLHRLWTPKELTTSKRLPYQFSGWCSLLWVPAYYRHKEAVFTRTNHLANFYCTYIAFCIIHHTLALPYDTWPQTIPV